MPAPEPINPPCYICGIDQVVGNPNGMLSDSTCAEVELDGLQGMFTLSECACQRASAKANCECMAVADFDCRIDTCTQYSSMADIKIATEYRKATVCMCASLIAVNNCGCSGSSDDTITIPANKGMTIECTRDPAGCQVECPNAAFIVEGNLTIEGNG